MSKSTRFTSGYKIADYVGTGKEFNQSDVPTNRAVVRMGLLLKVGNCFNSVSEDNLYNYRIENY